MWPDRISNPEPRTPDVGALPIALRGPARWQSMKYRSAVQISATSLETILKLYVLKAADLWIENQMPALHLLKQ